MIKITKITNQIRQKIAKINYRREVSIKKDKGSKLSDLQIFNDEKQIESTHDRCTYVDIFVQRQRRIVTYQRNSELVREHSLVNML